ncbi:hypothetical protein H8356DRAFT_1429206 [Neocallimastix lanati (nom. inval.)]|nr:hypothetical protein H8356DRAFT_1429206 [Neocallimastix sp. JGI-2020a]
MRFICPEYNSIKSQMSRNLNKNYHSIDSFYTTSFAILQNKEQETYKIFKKLKKNVNTSNEISFLIERYKNIETKLIDTKCDRNNTINLWFDCLTDLNNII